MTQNLIRLDLADYNEITQKYQMWMTGNSNAEPPEPNNDRVRVVGAHFVTICLALKSTFD